ncbi:hypothetical protein EW026_g678 [Hermanssonia centrifuga]|uniref:Uncharacterized protein n=1 Tax=Hermanssonia centrifuga TaxID=98765 RepID=A0A4V3XBJ8_9APHY|nr:hypothetical protein EW026_g678 [Hermanssonia centrifuga]
MLEIVSLHLKLSDLVTRAITILQDYDCETLGDPQTAVSHLGDVVLFVQCTMARYNLSPSALGVLDEKRLSSAFLNSPTVAYRLEDLKGEDLVAFNTWYKALFDVGTSLAEDYNHFTQIDSPKKSLAHIRNYILMRYISMCGRQDGKRTVE